MPRAKEFKYLGILFMSCSIMKLQTDGRIDAATGAVTRVFWIVLVKRELSQKVKFFICQSIDVPAVTTPHLFLSTLISSGCVSGTW